MNHTACFVMALSSILSASACSSTTGGQGQGDSGGPGKDSGHADAAPADAFLGHWTCSSMATTMFTAPAGTPSKSTNIVALVVNTDDGKGNITSVHTPEDGGTLCTFHVKLGADGKSATFEPTSCMNASGGATTYTGNTWTLKSPTSYDTAFMYDFSGKTMTGATLTGTGSGSGTCTKM